MLSPSLRMQKKIEYPPPPAWASNQPNFNVDSMLNQRYVPAGFSPIEIHFSNYPKV